LVLHNGANCTSAVMLPIRDCLLVMSVDWRQGWWRAVKVILYTCGRWTPRMEIRHWMKLRRSRWMSG